MGKNKPAKTEQMEIIMHLSTETCANGNYLTWKR